MKKYSKEIKTFIKKIDFFATYISFKVNEEIEYKSLIGGTFTIIYVIFALGYIIIMSTNFIKRKNLNFIYSNKIMRQPFVNLSDISFTFAFGIQYSESTFPAIEDLYLYFNYTIKLIEWVGKDDINEKYLQFRKCEVTDFPNLEIRYYLNDLDDMLCPIYDSYTNFSIDGLYTNNYYKFISIKLSLTDYAFENYETLTQLLNENPIEMAIFFKDISIDYENRKKPLLPYLNFNYKGIDLDFIKKTIITISSLEFISDENFFIGNSNLTTEAMFSSSQDSFRYIRQREENKENEIFEYIIEANPKLVQLKRIYEKLPQFVASISGILGFICLVLLVIANLIERKAINQKLIHRMLKFRGNKNIDINYFTQKFKNKIKKDLNKFNKEIHYQNTIYEDDFLEKENSINHNISHDLNQNLISEGINIINTESTPQNIVKNIISESTKNKEVRINKKDINSSKENKLENHIKIQLKNKTRDLEKEINEISSMKEINKTEMTNQTLESKKEQEDLAKLNIIQIIYTVLCSFCSKKWNKKYKLIKSAEKKIHYYMDIITYIKTVQEFELLKEMLFNENFLRLFQFVSKPTMKILNNDFVFCHHFERENIPFKIIGKKEIDVLYTNYKEILQEQLTKEKLKLLNLIKGEINFLEK